MNDSKRDGGQCKSEIVYEEREVRVRIQGGVKERKDDVRLRFI